jgi:hypothetical protein
MTFETRHSNLWTPPAQSIVLQPTTRLALCRYVNRANWISCNAITLMMEMEYIPGMIVCWNHWCSSGPEKILLNLRILNYVKPLLLPPYKFMCLTSFYYWVQVINYYGIWASSNGIMSKQSPQKWVSSMTGETNDTHKHTHTHTHHMAWWSQQPARYLLGTKVQHKKCVQNASE